MTDYTELVKALRCCATMTCKGDECKYMILGCHDCFPKLHDDAAAAIEALQAELEKKRTADCWGCKCEKIEPKQGEWELIDGSEPMRWGCSRCKYLSWETSNYCPRCGAKMEVQE